MVASLGGQLGPISLNVCWRLVFISSRRSKLFDCSPAPAPSNASHHLAVSSTSAFLMDALELDAVRFSFVIEFIHQEKLRS